MGELTSPVLEWNLANTLRASSFLPLAYSHRGDSAMNRTKIRLMPAGPHCRYIGPRQAMSPLALPKGIEIPDARICKGQFQVVQEQRQLPTCPTAIRQHQDICCDDPVLTVVERVEDSHPASSRDWGSDLRDVTLGGGVRSGTSKPCQESTAEEHRHPCSVCGDDCPGTVKRIRIKFRPNSA